LFRWRAVEVFFGTQRGQSWSRVIRVWFGFVRPDRAWTRIGWTGREPAWFICFARLAGRCRLPGSRRRPTSRSRRF